MLNKIYQKETKPIAHGATRKQLNSDTISPPCHFLGKGVGIHQRGNMKAIYRRSTQLVWSEQPGQPAVKRDLSNMFSYRLVIWRRLMLNLWVLWKTNKLSLHEDIPPYDWNRNPQKPEYRKKRIIRNGKWKPQTLRRVDTHIWVRGQTHEHKMPHSNK